MLMDSVQKDGSSCQHELPRVGSGLSVLHGPLQGRHSWTRRGFLVLEDVDEDAQDADATFTDDPRLMAYSDPKWQGVLVKHLRAKDEERLRLQRARVALFRHRSIL